MRLLPVPRDLSVERGHVTATLAGIESITFDFGNTLVPVSRGAFRRVVELTASAVARADPSIDREAFLIAWAEERERQFREDVPAFREVDLAERLVRVFARLRGMSPPPPDEAWDQARAAELSDAAEIETTIETYSHAFVEGLADDGTVLGLLLEFAHVGVDVRRSLQDVSEGVEGLRALIVPRAPGDDGATPGVDDLLVRLADGGRGLAILSNWPLAATVDRYVDARGWRPFLRAVVISHRVGVIKPHPAIFAAARSALGDPAPSAILHVGDDWAADVAGAAAVGWRTAWVSGRPADTPLPTSDRPPSIRADLELDSIADLDRHLAWVGPRVAERSG